jgi:hypothetical protein
MLKSSNTAFLFLMSLLCLGGLLLPACEDEGTDNSGSLSAVVGQEAWQADRANFEVSNNTTFIRSFRTETQTRLIVSFAGTAGDTGTFPIVDTANSATQIQLIREENNRTFTSDSGRIVVSSFEEGNLSGTFSGRLLSASGADTLRVRTGKFVGITKE